MKKLKPGDRFNRFQKMKGKKKVKKVIKSAKKLPPKAKVAMKGGV